ncbi:siderophore-interacting protein [Dasania marina]|uniref:siderophore-interacting protein n=1 Tax=Dasania marina TaxID=471499 RepID=UPI0030DDD96D|tara:strand:+ start:10870 stop:11619 length:750 start_codon:yes stop_codon:yes gene_type:complete
MPKLSSRKLTVIRSQQITTNMQRITLGGSALKGFPTNQDGAYIKLLLPDNHQHSAATRTYTVRNYREAFNELDVDFVLHGDGGPASAWATRAQPGDEITIAGPGGKKLLDFSADWFLLAGDMTALPAISVNIEQLPDHARGYAVIEILHESDIQTFQTPDAFEIKWIINPTPEKENTLLLDKVMQQPWLEGNPSIWAACEFSGMRALRRYFKQEKEVAKKALYVSSYWKRGLSEELHKKVKRTDAESAD